MLSAAVKDVEIFLKMKDDSLLDRILEEESTNPEEQRLINRIQCRKLYRQIAEIRIPATKFDEEKEDIKKQVIENFLEEKKKVKDAKLEETLKNSLDIDIEKFDFGMKGVDPMKFVNFYYFEKDDDDDEKKQMPKYLPPNEDQSVSSLLSPNVEEWFVSLIWKPIEKRDKNEMETLKSAFQKWFDDWKDKQDTHPGPSAEKRVRH